MPSGEDYDKIQAMAQALRGMMESMSAMANDLDGMLDAASVGEDENSHASAGDVEEGREIIGPSPADDVDRVVKVIRLNLGD